MTNIPKVTTVDYSNLQQGELIHFTLTSTNVN